MATGWENGESKFPWRQQGRKLVVTDHFLVARLSEDSVSTVHPLERTMMDDHHADYAPYHSFGADVRRQWWSCD